MSEWNIQKAIYSALNGALSVSVFDYVPQDTDFPYVVVGDDTHEPWDTDTETGLESTVTVHPWTRGDRGRKTNKDLQAIIYTTLHRASFAVTGGDMVNLEFEFSDTTRDADGHTVQGVQRFRMLFEYS